MSLIVILTHLEVPLCLGSTPNVIYKHHYLFPFRHL